MLAGVDEGVQSGLNLVDIGPRPGINICQNQVRIIGSYSRSNAMSDSVEHRSKVSDLGSLGATVWGHHGMTSTFALGGVSGKRLALEPSLTAILLAFITNFRTS